MKKLTFSVIAISLVMGLSLSCKQSLEGEKLEQQAKIIKEQAMLIKLFDNYYHSTEEFLDSLHIDPDTDLETDAGVQYLEDIYQLNKKFNQLESNPNNRH